MADWKKQDFTIPDWATSASETVNTGAQSVSMVLQSALHIAHAAEAWGTSITNPTSLALKAIITQLEGLRSDLQHMGFYISGDWDQSQIASLAGGYSQYQQRMYARLRDRQDPEYPNISPSTQVMAIFTYLSVGGIADVPNLQRFLDQSQRFFGIVESPPVETLPTPIDVTIRYGVPALPFAFWTEACGAADTHVRVSWSLPIGSVGFEPSQFLVQTSSFPDGLPISATLPDKLSGQAVTPLVDREVLNTTGQHLILTGSPADVSTTLDMTLWTDPQGYPVELKTGFWGSTHLVSAERRAFSTDDRWGVTLALADLPQQPTISRASIPATCSAGRVQPPLYVTVRTLGEGDLPAWEAWEQEGQPVAMQVGAEMSPPSTVREIVTAVKASVTAEQQVLEGLAGAIVVSILAGWWQPEHPENQVFQALKPWVEASLGSSVEDWLRSNQSQLKFRSRLWSTAYQVASRLWNRTGSHQGDLGQVMAGLVPYAKIVNGWKLDGMTLQQHCKSLDISAGLAAAVDRGPTDFFLVSIQQFGLEAAKSMTNVPVSYTGWLGSGFDSGTLSPVMPPTDVVNASRSLLAGRATKMPDRYGWQSVTAAPMLGWADQMLLLGLDFARQGLSANAGTDALLDRQVHLLEHKISELTRLIEQLDNLIAFPARFGFGTSVQVLVVDASGVEGVIDALAQAGNPPQDGAGFYTAGSVALLAGVPEAGVALVRGLL